MGEKDGQARALENLLESLERYRRLENQAVAKIKEQLAEKGIEILEEQIRGMDRESIRERLLETRERRIREEKEQKEQEEREPGRNKQEKSR